MTPRVTRDGEVWRWGDADYRGPVRLFPFALLAGMPDRATGKAVCDHLAEATPPTIIPANPLTHWRMTRCLRNLHVESY